MSNAAASLPVEQTAIRKVATRLVPFVALMFFINFLDRTAIGFAAPNGMEEDLALTATQFGFASGVFFIGYILLEVPSNIALHKVGARRWRDFKSNLALHSQLFKRALLPPSLISRLLLFYSCGHATRRVEACARGTLHSQLSWAPSVFRSRCL